MTTFIFRSPADYTSFFFFNDTATPELYTLSLHDALPICQRQPGVRDRVRRPRQRLRHPPTQSSPLPGCEDRKSTRLNSSHVERSYAVSCLKKKTRMPSSA